MTMMAYRCLLAGPEPDTHQPFKQLHGQCSSCGQAYYVQMPTNCKARVRVNL